jgi:regulatory protein munI
MYCGILYAGGLAMLIQQKFGQKIQLLRKERGLSQEKFALLIDMDRTYYASVEAGKRNISLVNIKKIADGLGVSISHLFENIE